VNDVADSRVPSRATALAVLGALLAPAFLAVPLAAQRSVPAAVTVEIDTSALTTRGIATARIEFEPLEAIDTVLGIRLELRRGRELLQRRDHLPPTPTDRWQPGERIRYELSLPFQGLADVDPDERTVLVYVGFLDPEARGGVRPPRGAGGLLEGMTRSAVFELPEIERSEETEAERRSRITAAIAAAKALARTDAEQAWQTLEFAFRQLGEGDDSYPLKGELRDALFEIGQKTEPAPLTFEEEAIVRGRIREERARYLRLVAGRMFDRGKYHGALMLLDEVGGELEEQSGAAVLGDVDEAKRASRRREEIVARIFAPDERHQAHANELRAQLGRASVELLERAVELASSPPDRPTAWMLLRGLGDLNLTELREPAREALADLERRWLAETPPDEREEAEAAMRHPCWARTTVRASRCFLILGPDRFLASIPADSLLWFDLAYVYVTDLFGRVPNPGGDRVTVYFKELWDFGGGVGGGKRIDIGKTDHEQRGTRLDTSLLFHELTHCVDDTAPVYGGMREGLGDFGATFAQAELGRRGEARAAIGRALGAFQADYVDRDLEYWRIPEYGPSAGLLLHFLVEYGRTESGGYAWQRYRDFFRAYRECPVKDARTPTLARAFAHHLVEAFGAPAFDDLVRFRWPLVASDREAVAIEHVAARTKRRDAGDELVDFEGSPVPRDLRAREIVADGAGVDAFARGLGVITAWRVIGPFKEPGGDPDSFVFPPEYEVDLEARYPGNGNNRPFWREPGSRPPVVLTETGWLHYDFPYQNDSAIYALTHVTVAEAVDGWLHVRADDDVTVFVGDRLIGKYDYPHGPAGPWRPAALLPDAIRFPVRFEAGRNKVLIKVRNGGGPAGCAVAVTQRSGLPLTGFEADAGPPAAIDSRPPAPDVSDWRRPKLRFDWTRSGSTRGLDTKVGGFKARNRALAGTSTDRGVAWRKYTVRPGFPKDSPSNLLWLDERATEDATDFELTIDLEPDPDRAPKLAVIFQGDGSDDALCGHTLLLLPHGRSEIRVHLERYDRLVYQSPVLALGTSEDESLTLRVLVADARLSVSLGDAVAFDRVPIRTIRPGGSARTAIGLATWGPDPRLRAMTLRLPR
jgi:hypothetical protein